MSKVTQKLSKYTVDSKIVDTLLHSGIITVGNENDYINMFNRVCPNISDNLRIDIVDTLEESLSKDVKIKYLFTQKPSEEENVLSFQIPTGYLYFTNL